MTLSVCQLTTFYSEMGGVERAVHDLSRGLAARDHRVEVLCTTFGADKCVYDAGVRVQSCGSEFGIAGRPLSLSLFAAMNEQNVDVIQYHLPFPLATLMAPLARPQARLKVVTWHHGIERYPNFERFYRPSLTAFLQAQDAIFVTAPPMVTHVPLPEPFRDRCRVVPLGVDETSFLRPDEGRVQALRTKYGNGTPLILFVGRLVYYKGCDVLLRALAKVDANLVLVGEGPLCQELQMLVGELGIGSRVHFAGRVPESELADYYHASDIFVLPSVLPTECFGLVQVEAMLSGRPVINTSLSTGVPWVSRDGESGLTVAPGDVDALAQALSRLLINTELAKQLGAAGKRRALAEFTLSAHIASTEECYRELLAAKFAGALR